MITTGRAPLSVPPWWRVAGATVAAALALLGSVAVAPASSADGGEGCVAEPSASSYEVAAGEADPSVPVDGSIRVSGRDWCNLVGGGSLIAVKFDMGGYWATPGFVAPLFDANLGEEIGPCEATVCAANASIWYVIEAADDGSFDVEIPLPDGTNGPLLIEGSHTLQLLTRTIAADPYYQGSRPDPSRSITTPPFTVVAGAVDVAPEVTSHPADVTVPAGQAATFVAAASGTPAPSVRWESSTDGGSWTPIDGATSGTLALPAVSAAQSGTRYRAAFANDAGTAVTDHATLTVTAVDPDPDPGGPDPVDPDGEDHFREHCGAAYGPRPADIGIGFCFAGPERVVVGEDIVIRGVGGYLAIDDATGSVVNFFLDAEFSGDPNTLFTRREVRHPVTGAVIGDRRSHAVVQAHGDGTWEVRIPFPTDENAYTNPEQDVTALWSTGTQHSVRMLTGSLLTSPLDRQRGASLYFTVVESLDDDVEVAEPIYEHQTYTSEAEGDGAVAWVQQDVDRGGAIALIGTGWLAKDGERPSIIHVRLQDETGAYRQRSGEAGDGHVDPDDPTLWQAVPAGDDGTVVTSLPLPSGLAGGGFLAVELTTLDDGTPAGDVGRRWVSEPLTIDGLPYIPAPGDDATCTAGQREYTYELAPGMAVPAANVGGTIRLRGEKWCNLIGGGSLIAIKINAGGYSHLPTVTAAHYDANLGRETGPSPATISQTNKTIWYVIEADDEGRFDVDIPLPDRTSSVPSFGEGAYTLQLLTRTLSADPHYAGTRPDPSRSVQTAEFTVVAEGVPLDDVQPGEPTAAPEPLHVTEDLTDTTRGSVTVDQQAARWVVTVPTAEPGDWVYVNVYDGASPRFPWGNQWFQLDADRRVHAPLAGATLPVGTNKLSVQDRDGGSLGWATVTVAAPPPSDEGTTPTPTTSPGSGRSPGRGPSSAGRRVATTPVRSIGPDATSVGQPQAEPPPPVASYDDLGEHNVGGVTAVDQGGAVVVTLPEVAAGHWAFVYLYTEGGKVLPVGWVQVGSDHTLTLEIGTLPDGLHKLAFVDADGELVGWTTATGPDADDASAARGPGRAEEETGATVLNAGAVRSAGPGGPSALLFVAAAVLILSAAGAGAIALGTPRRPKS